MRRIVGFVKSHFDSWDEICLNDSARLRLNLLLFSFVISAVFFVMSVRTAFAVGPRAAAVTALFCVVTFSLFLWQFFRRQYSPLIAWAFGVMSLAMAALFISTGAIENTGHIWICILPIVGTMMVPFRSTLLYNGVLLALLGCLLKSPLYEKIPAEYTPYMRTVFPISILILILCNYVAEYTRKRTQKQLTILTERLRNYAFTDPLTGAYNRRALTAHFGEQSESAFGLSFAMLDLDFFKNINDTHGHEIGDKLLCHLVYLVNKHMPPGAQLYRWGGEEFLLIVKSGDRAMLCRLLENIRKAAEETPLVLLSEQGEPVLQLCATVSIGGMVASRDDDIAKSISRADEQMYLAKTNGRNKVFVQENCVSHENFGL